MGSGCPTQTSRCCCCRRCFTRQIFLVFSFLKGTGEVQREHRLEQELRKSCHLARQGIGLLTGTCHRQVFLLHRGVVGDWWCERETEFVSLHTSHSALSLYPFTQTSSLAASSSCTTTALSLSQVLQELDPNNTAAKLEAEREREEKERQLQQTLAADNESSDGE